MNTCYCVVNFETFWRFTKLHQMNVGRKNSSLTPKKVAKPAENSNYSDACRLCGIISVGNKNNQWIFQPFPSPKRNFDILNFCQNQLEEPTKHLFLQVNEKWPPFARALTPILQDKKQTDDWNQNILQKILLKSMPFWPEPRSDKCHFLSLKLSTLSYALMNSIVPSTNQVLLFLEQLTQRTPERVKLLQSPYFFRPVTPTLLTPPPLPTGILYSPQYRSHQETKMATHRTQRSTSTISQKNRGLRTVYLKLIIIGTLYCCDAVKLSAVAHVHHQWRISWIES